MVPKPPQKIVKILSWFCGMKMVVTEAVGRFVGLPFKQTQQKFLVHLYHSMCLRRIAQ